MAIDRWDPFREMALLRDAMERAFQEGVMRPASALLPTGRGSIPIDVSEEGDTYILHASLPGVRPEDTQVTIAGNAVTIRATTTHDERREGRNYLVHERRSGSVGRTITLPTTINADQANASFQHGVLTLRLPKLQSAQPRRIPVANGERGTTHAQRGEQGSQRDSTASSETAPGQGNADYAQASMRDSAENGNEITAGHGAHLNGHDHSPHASSHSGGTNGVTEASKESFPASDPPAWTPEKI